MSYVNPTSITAKVDIPLIHTRLESTLAQDMPVCQRKERKAPAPGDPFGARAYGKVKD